MGYIRRWKPVENKPTKEYLEGRQRVVGMALDDAAAWMVGRWDFEEDEQSRCCCKNFDGEAKQLRQGAMWAFTNP